MLYGELRAIVYWILRKLYKKYWFRVFLSSYHYEEEPKKCSVGFGRHHVLFKNGFKEFLGFMGYHDYYEEWKTFSLGFGIWHHGLQEWSQIAFRFYGLSWWLSTVKGAFKFDHKKWFKKFGFLGFMMVFIKTGFLFLQDLKVIFFKNESVGFSLII